MGIPWRRYLRWFSNPEESERALPTFRPNVDGSTCRIVSGNEPNKGKCSTCKSGCDRFNS